jgi:hypothetical protein
VKRSLTANLSPDARGDGKHKKNVPVCFCFYYIAYLYIAYLYIAYLLLGWVAVGLYLHTNDMSTHTRTRAHRWT